MLFDIDTTLLNAYSGQEGAAFNYHYQDKGYPGKVIAKHCRFNIRTPAGAP